MRKTKFSLVLITILLSTSCAGEQKVRTKERDQPPVSFDERVDLIKQDYQEKMPAKTPATITPAATANIDPLTREGLAAQKSNTAPAPEPLKKLSIPSVGASESPQSDKIHDVQNNAIVTLQDPVAALHDFPRDRRMQVDWVKALDQGLIEPRADLLGKSQMTTLDKDIVFKNTQFMPWVRFPHIAHTKWLACENCHPKIFIPQQGANPISMNKVLRGEYCGVCHDKVAFSLFICERCHSVPHAGSGPKWW